MVANVQSLAKALTDEDSPEKLLERQIEAELPKIERELKIKGQYTLTDAQGHRFLISANGGQT